MLLPHHLTTLRDPDEAVSPSRIVIDFANVLLRALVFSHFYDVVVELIQSFDNYGRL